jgi:hypothetical protein
MKQVSMQAMQDAALKAFTLTRDEVDSLFKRCGSDTPDITPTLKSLFWYLSARSQAVSFLLSHGYAWDAEIILRSFYETAAKIMLVCLAEPVDQPQLVDEFWNKLGTVNSRRTARKAALAEKVFESNSLSGPIFQALQDTRIFPLEDETSKAERRRLEQKWSFTEIIENLSRRETRLSGLNSILHMYGMASHLAHADNAAMDLMADRATREPHERRLLEASHASRIISDQVSLWWFCADVLRRHYRTEFENAKRLKEAFDETHELGKPFKQAFEDSQRDFYRSYGYGDPIK